jgi:hypothetical protein
MKSAVLSCPHSILSGIAPNKETQHSTEDRTGGGDDPGLRDLSRRLQRRARIPYLTSQ